MATQNETKSEEKKILKKKKQKKIFWILKMRFLWARRRNRTRSETIWTKRRKTLRDVTFFFRHGLTLVFGLRCRFHLCRRYKICRILYVAVRTVGTLPLTRRIQSLYSKLLFFFANHFYRVALSYEFGALYFLFLRH